MPRHSGWGVTGFTNKYYPQSDSVIMVSKIIRILIKGCWLLVICLSISRVLFAFEKRPASPGNIRIAIVQDKKQITLSIKGNYKIFSLISRELLQKADYLKKSNIKLEDAYLKIGDSLVLKPPIEIIPRVDGTIYINDRRFRGFIDITEGKSGYLLVINKLNIEDYVKGVLYHEASHFWPMEALAAQAIAVRTYALYQAKVNKDSDFDLTTDFFTQMYGGRTSEKFRTNQAIILTRGQILTYKGKIFSTYYHATCGGHTEDAGNLWNIKLPTLGGLKCNFCQNSPHFKWQAKVSKQEISRKLLNHGFRVGKIKAIKIIHKNTSGRISELEIKGEVRKISLTGKDFRLILGPKLIRSTNFDIRLINDQILFRGLGWGHGVGLCQWGAYFMARQGRSCQEILKYYYPGSKLKRLR